MPQNSAQSRGADDRCIGRRVFGVDRRWVDDGTVQALVVAGDAVSRNHTNHLVIAGIPVTDPDPATMATGYEQGDFDGYAVQATVTDGVLTIAPGAGAFDPTLCFIEIGPEGTTITPDVETRLAELVESMTTATYAAQAPSLARRQYVFGSYVDELLSYTVGSSRYFVHGNHLYSPSAVTNAAGQVQERYRYDAYGKQTITTATGTTRNQSAVGFTRGFTGYILDEETGLYYARTRMYSAGLGRFVSRDPLVYVDGMSLYKGYFVPNGLDPTGMDYIIILVKDSPGPQPPAPGPNPPSPLVPGNGTGDADNDNLVQAAEAHNAEVDKLLAALQKATDKWFNKAVSEGKVKYRGVAFAGSLADYREKIAKEKVRVLTQTTGGLNELGDAIQQANANGDSVHVWGHSQDNQNGMGNQFLTPNGPVPQEAATKTMETKEAAFTTCDPAEGILRKVRLNWSPWQVGGGGVSPTDPVIQGGGGL